MLAALHRLFRSMDHEWLEVHLCALKIVWGVWLLLPFRVLSGGTAYENISSIMPEEAWGALFLIMGTVQLYSVLKENQIKIRSAITLFAIFLWSIVAFMSFVGNAHSTAGVTMVIFTISNTLVYLRLRALQKQSRSALSPSKKNVV